MPEVNAYCIKIHLNVRTVSLHYLLCLPTNESVYQYSPVIGAIHRLKTERTLMSEKIQRASILTLENVNQSTLFTRIVSRQSFARNNTIYTQNRNIYFLSELGQSILHFHNQVKVNSYICVNTTLYLL